MRPCKLHLGRKVSIYAFCGTLAAKVILINCENVFPSGKKGVARTAGVSRDILPTVSCIFGDTGREVEDRNVRVIFTLPCATDAFPAKYGITVRQVSSEIQLDLKTFRLALKDYPEIGR